MFDLELHLLQYKSCKQTKQLYLKGERKWTYKEKAAQALAEVLLPVFGTGEAVMVEAIAQDLTQILADKELLADNLPEEN